MSRIAVLLVASLALASRLDGQSFLVGIRGGSTSATQHASFQYDRLRGLSAGVMAGVEIQSWLALELEALYVEKGARSDRTFEMHIAYLEAPLLARLSLPFGIKGVHPFVLGGLAPSVELRCSGYTTPFKLDNSRRPPGTVPVECSSYRQGYSDRGDVRGGGLVLHRGRHQYSVELRRTRGLRDISGYDCCFRRNDVTSVMIGAAMKLR